MSKLSEISSYYNIDPQSSNIYNPSTGNFRPYISEELENMIKTLKIDSTSHKLLNDYSDNTLATVIDCLLYYHYNAIDVKILKGFFFEFSQKLCENPLEKEELEDFWVQQTAFIQYNIDEKNRSSIKPQNIKQKHIQQFEADLLTLELAVEFSKGDV
jgi:hypothetical protein